jgi:hypothetical protein
MPKADRKRKPLLLSPKEAGYTIMPWSCNHHPTFSEIEAYIPITGNFEIIADIHDSKGVDAEIVAGLLVRAVNIYEKNNDMIAQMVAAIERCLTCADCLTWEAEHEAQVVLKRAREMGRRYTSQESF